MDNPPESAQETFPYMATLDGWSDLNSPPSEDQENLSTNRIDTVATPPSPDLEVTVQFMIIDDETAEWRLERSVIEICKTHVSQVMTPTHLFMFFRSKALLSRLRLAAPGFPRNIKRVDAGDSYAGYVIPKPFYLCSVHDDAITGLANRSFWQMEDIKDYSVSTHPTIGDFLYLNVLITKHRTRETREDSTLGGL